MLRILIVVALASAAAAQQTRVEEIEAERDRKAAMLEPDLPTKLEAQLIRLKEDRLLEKLQAGIGGFRGSLGGLPNGSGLAVGTNYSHRLGAWALDGSATVSSEGWTRLEAGIAPADTGRWMTDLRVARRDYGSLRSPDPNHRYALLDSAVDLLAGYQLRRDISAGAGFGYQDASLDGDDARWARAGAFLKFDTRDAARRSGSLLVTRFDAYESLDLAPYDFRRFDGELQRYVSFLNQRRVIALRARTVQTFTSGPNVVPLLHQSVLGGADDLRGYRPFRFQGANLVLMNVEYRWEVFSGLDMALFGDIGQVSARRWDVGRLEKSAGFGFRFNARNVTFLRIDTGFSRDGAQVSIRFNDLFRDRRLNSSSAAHLF